MTSFWASAECDVIGIVTSLEKTQSLPSKILRTAGETEKCHSTCCMLPCPQRLNIGHLIWPSQQLHEVGKTCTVHHPHLVGKKTRAQRDDVDWLNSHMRQSQHWAGLLNVSLQFLGLNHSGMALAWPVIGTPALAISESTAFPLTTILLFKKCWSLLRPRVVWRKTDI